MEQSFVDFCCMEILILENTYIFYFTHVSTVCSILKKNVIKVSISHVLLINIMK